MAEEREEHVLEYRIPFPEERLADIAKQAVEVDQELHPDLVSRSFTVDGSTLVVYVLLSSVCMVCVQVCRVVERVVYV